MDLEKDKKRPYDSSSETLQSIPLKKRFLQDDSSISNENKMLDNVDDESEEDPYDEDLYLNDEDRERLSLLPETKREDVLFERSEERKRIQERNQLKRALRQKTNTLTSDKKRETKSRAVKEGNGRKSKALDDIVARREKKHSTKRSQQYDDEDDDYVEDYKPGKKSGHVHRISTDDLKEMLDEIKYEDILKAQVTRNDLEAWIDEPYWDKVIRNLFVRVGVGESDSKGYVYKIAEIAEPVDLGGKQYKLGKKKTSKCLKLNLAGSTKDFQMEYVSNKPFTEEEFSAWKRMMMKQDYEPPTTKQLDVLIKNIEYARNYHYTEEDLDKIVQKNRMEFRKKGITVDYNHEVKILKAQIKAAESRDEKEKVEELKQTLIKLHENQKKKEEEMYRNAPNVEAINRKNKELNSGPIAKQKREIHKAQSVNGSEKDIEVSGKKVISLNDYIKLKGVK